MVPGLTADILGCYAKDVLRITVKNSFSLRGIFGFFKSQSASNPSAGSAGSLQAGLGHRAAEAGQALLIVVLVMVVALTVGLAVVARSITYVRISTEEENSQRAFSAAEAGAEQVFRTGLSITGVPLNNIATVEDARITDLGNSDSFLVNNGTLVQKNDGVDVWLAPHHGDGTIDYTRLGLGTMTIYWGNTGACNTTKAAIEVIIVSRTNNGNFSTQRLGFDPCTDRRAINNFTAPLPAVSMSIPSTDPNEDFTIGTPPINITNAVVVRIAPLYASSVIGVSRSTGTFPSQGKVIESTGTSGGTKRKIVIYKGFSKLPSEYFEYSAFTAQ